MPVEPRTVAGLYHFTSVAIKAALQTLVRWKGAQFNAAGGATRSDGVDLWSPGMRCRGAVSNHLSNGCSHLRSHGLERHHAATGRRYTPQSGVYWETLQIIGKCHWTAKGRTDGGQGLGLPPECAQHPVRQYELLHRGG